MADVKEMRYIIDTSSILSQKPDENYRRNVYKTLWDRIDYMVESQEIVTCSEIADEVEDESIKVWMTKCKMKVLPIDDEIQDNVCLIVNEVNKNIVDFKANKSSGDVFLIATAQKYGLTVITEEGKNSPKKIPYTCNLLGIRCVNILEFMEENNIGL